MEVNFRHNTVFLFAPLYPDGTRWPRSNGCNALLSRTSRSRAIIRQSITHIGGGEGTSANSRRLPRCKSKRKSLSRSKVRFCPQIPMFAFTVQPGRATVKSQKLKSAEMAEQHGARQAWLAHPNRMRGGFGNLVGALRPNQDKQPWSRAQPTQRAVSSHHIATLIEALT